MRRVWGDKTSITTALVLVLCGQPSSRAEPPAVAPEATEVDRASAFGEISLPHSHVYIHVGKVGLGHEHAVVCQLKQGTLHLGATRSAGLLVFDMQSMDADSSRARQYIGLEGETAESTREQVNENMRGKEVLHIAKYPTATFVIDSAIEMPVTSVDGFTQFELQGKFTLHGVNRPLRLTAQIVEEKNGYQRLRAGFTILQSDFGIKPFSKAFGAVGVTDELKIYGDAWLRKESPARLGTQTPNSDNSR